MKSAKSKINEMITQKMIDRIRETGTLPWHQPWQSNAQRPRSLITGKPYRGVNAFMLHMYGYESPFWLTLKQVNERGGHIRKGEHSCPVVFFKIIEPKETDADQKKFILLRYYRVFNVAQCDGLKSKRLDEPSEPITGELPDAASVIEDMPGCPEIRYGYRQAAYSPPLDRVKMPERAQFLSGEAFYATLFHELAHSTGHPSRLNRKSLMTAAEFGSELYSQEELVAEMTAGFLCGHCGFLSKTEEESAAYLSHWLKALEANPEMLVKAGCQAQKAYDYITNAETAYQQTASAAVETVNETTEGWRIPLNQGEHHDNYPDAA
jgi:antirestriction protein ArdC